MKKKVTSFNLDELVIQRLKKECLKEDRKMSNYLERLLRKTFNMPKEEE